MPITGSQPQGQTLAPARFMLKKRRTVNAQLLPRLNCLGQRDFQQLESGGARLRLNGSNVCATGWNADALGPLPGPAASELLGRGEGASAHLFSCLVQVEFIYSKMHRS